MADPNQALANLWLGAAPRFKYVSELTNYQAEQPVIRATQMSAPERIIDYKSFFGRLREIGYRGYLVYEMCEVLDGGGSIDNLDRTAKDFLKFINGLRTVP